MTFKLDYKAAKDYLLTLIEITKGVSEEIERMCKIVENLDIFWDSDAGNEYIIRFEADVYTAEVLLKKIKSSAVILSRALYKGQKNEQSIEDMIERM